MKILSSLVVLAAVIGFVVAIDYCDKKYCKDVKHVACGHNGKFAKSCSSDAVLVNIDEKLKNVLLDAFNERRNFIAGGSEKGFRPACRMGTMRWDNELAELAKLNVKQCQMKHDCHNTNTFGYSGQNLWASMRYEGEADHVDNLQSSVRSWYSEVNKSSAAEINKFTPGGPVTGHFLPMTIENNDHVGCAASEYSRDGVITYLVACNFATVYTVGATIYYACNKPGMDCKTGTNPKFPNLCSINEKYHYYFNWPDKKE